MLGNTTIQRNLMTINTYIKMEYSQLVLYCKTKRGLGNLDLDKK